MICWSAANALLHEPLRTQKNTAYPGWPAQPLTPDWNYMLEPPQPQSAADPRGGGGSLGVGRGQRGRWGGPPSNTVIEGSRASARPMKTLAITRRKVKPVLSFLRGQVSMFGKQEMQPDDLLDLSGVQSVTPLLSIFLSFFFDLFFSFLFFCFYPPSCLSDCAQPSISHDCTQTIRSPLTYLLGGCWCCPFSRRMVSGVSAAEN